MSIIRRVRSQISQRYRHIGSYNRSLDRLNRLPLLQDFIRRSPGVPVFDTREALWDHLAERVPGAIDYLEFGVHAGHSLLHWAARNGDSASRFFGFDTFEGLPESWNWQFGKGHFDRQGQAPETGDPRITFVKGLFQDTLDAFLADYRPQGAHRVVHIDCDLYSSALFCLTKLDRVLAPGTMVIFDEFGDVQNEFRALNDYMSAYMRGAKMIAAHDDYFTAAVEML